MNCSSEPSCSKQQQQPTHHNNNNNDKKPKPANGQQITFARTMTDLRDCVWYWGCITWQQAERALADKPSGSFLLRDSTSDRYIFTISFKNEHAVQHFRLPYHHGNFSFSGANSPLKSDNVAEFIQLTTERSSDGQMMFLSHPKHAIDRAENIKLIHPVSRLTLIPSLKHQCRFVIRRCVPEDRVDRLPVPPHLRQYLSYPHCIVEIPANWQ